MRAKSLSGDVFWASVRTIRRGRGRAAFWGEPMRRTRAVVLLTAGCLVAAGSTSAAQAAPVRKAGAPVVVVTGLNNPRQLSLVSQGLLLIAEAGKAGPTKITVPGPEGGDQFIGATGSISGVAFPQVVQGQHPHRLITGLFSIGGDPSGVGTTGADGVSATSVFGKVYVQETAGAPELPQPLRAQGGKLLSGFWFQKPRPVADITGFEEANDPDGHGVESNPYAVLARRDGTQLVADAAGNDVLKVAADGSVSVWHVFANITTGACAGQFDPSPAFPGCNYVPTSLASDRDGNIYVGGLVSEAPGEGRVTKLDPTGRHVLRTWSGFSAVTGLAVGRDGALYVSEFGAPEQAPIDPGVSGVLTRVAPNGARSHVDVPFAAGVAVDALNNVFVSAFSIAPETGLAPVPVDTSGQVWRVRF